MTRHNLKSEILATKIRMTEICRLLLFTLLLHIFWLTSANVNRAVTRAEDLINSLLEKYISSGCKGAQDAVAIAQSDAEEILDGRYSVGEKHILTQLLLYFSHDCKGFDPGTEDLSFSAGQKHIIKLLASYFSSGCKVAIDAAGITPSPGYSTAETVIIKQLSSYFSSPTCKEPPKATDNDTFTDRIPGSSAAGHHVQSVFELFLLICGVYFTRVELLA